MKRRKFCGLFSLGAMVSCFPLILAACSSSEQGNSNSNSSDSASSNTVARADGFVAVGLVSDLTQNGAILSKTTSGEPIIVVQDAQSNIYAVNSLCTHQGCNVGWKKDSQDLYCACHGSHFASNGTVTQGPAKEALKQYEVKQENGSILIKA